jgi:prephenate dehydrogenase
VAWQARIAGIPSVVGYAKDPADGFQALQAGALHDLADQPARAVRDADLVVLATPPRATMELLQTLGPHLRSDALVTDVASIKAPIVAQAVAAGLGRQFAGSHPFAGTHQGGWAGARPDRLQGAVVYVCSTGPAGDAAAREIMDCWRGVFGAHPVLIEAAAHDAQLAWTSHLPQVVATALARAVLERSDRRGASLGTGFRDTTRLAASPADMWVEILMLNVGPLREALTQQREELAELDALLARGDVAALRRWLQHGAELRRGLDAP